MGNQNHLHTIYQVYIQMIKLKKCSKNLKKMLKKDKEILGL